MPKPEMPAFTKSPPELVERFSSLLDRFPGADRRKMFGYPGAFVGGNMATGLFRDTWIVRLAEPDRAELLAIDGAAPFEPMPGRPMRGYVVLPRAIVADDTALESWVRRSVAYAESLPPKR
jgi:TfoX/Sxy family transcriptional regulator of competence genes